jgi:hypothetical protein
MFTHTADRPSCPRFGPIPVGAASPRAGLTCGPAGDPMWAPQRAGLRNRRVRGRPRTAPVARATAVPHRGHDCPIGRPSPASWRTITSLSDVVLVQPDSTDRLALRIDSHEGHRHSTPPAPPALDKITTDGTDVMPRDTSVPLLAIFTRSSHGPARSKSAGTGDLAAQRRVRPRRSGRDGPVPTDPRRDALPRRERRQRRPLGGPCSPTGSVMPTLRGPGLAALAVSGLASIPS